MYVYEPIAEIADTHTYNHVNGRRVSAYNAFVEPMIGNSLKVVKYARVVEVIYKYFMYYAC